MARYAAFLSYSHKDARVAARLQRALEGYRVPRRLVGTPGAFGPVPARLGAVFRDREDIAAGGDLADRVLGALAQADALLVLCSPDAAASRWVGQEIAAFKARAGDERVFAVIARGEPFADDPALEALPLALRRAVTADGRVTDVEVEPAAADARAVGDGWRLAVLKLLAGLLGVPLDALIRRDHARRQRALVLAVAASMLGTVAMGGLALEAVRARDAAAARRADAEGLVEFMLGDLRKKLDAVGRLDALDAVGVATLRYYGRQKPGSLSADDLARRARALTMVGELRQAQGDFPRAAAAFGQAAASTRELMARAPGDGGRVFDHAQSVFFLGALAEARGDFPAMRNALETYARLADRLVAIDPANEAWQAEVSSSRVNLGVLAMRERRFVEAERAFETANAIDTRLAARPGKHGTLLVNLAESAAWQADASRALGKLDAAQAARRRQRAILAGLLAQDSRNAELRGALAVAVAAQGELAADLGEPERARALLDTALGSLELVTRAEPTNVETLDRLDRVLISLASVEYRLRNRVRATALVERSGAVANGLLARDPTSARWSLRVSRAALLGAEIRLAEDGAGNHRAGLAAAEAIERAPPDTGSFDSWAWRARAKLYQARVDPTQNRWSALANWVERLPGDRRPLEACILAWSYRALGRLDNTEAIARELRRMGYRQLSCGVPTSAAGAPANKLL